MDMWHSNTRVGTQAQRGLALTIPALSRAVGTGSGCGPSGVYTSPAQAVAKDDTGAAPFGCRPAGRILIVCAVNVGACMYR